MVDTGHSSVGQYRHKLSWIHTTVHVVILLGLARGVWSQQQQACQDSEMQECVDPLKVLTDDRDLSFAATLEELDRVCPVLRQAMTCLDMFTSRCLKTAKKKMAVDMVYEGARNIISQVCSDTRFRIEYLEHAQCMKLHHAEYETCVDHYTDTTKTATKRPKGGGNTSNLPDGTSEKLRSVCCGFHRYVQCTVTLFRKRCGNNAANFTERYLMQMAGSLVKKSCSAFSANSTDCSSSASTSSISFKSHLSIFSLLITLWVFSRK